MKQTSILFLKTALVIIGVVVVAFMIWFPQAEGRAANLDVISIYADPFVIYMYITLIPFFVALFQAFKLLGYVDNNKVFSQVALTALRNIKYCAFAIIGFFIGAILFIRFMAHGDDPAGPTMIGLITIFMSLVVASVSNVLEGVLKNAINVKSKNNK